MGKSDSSELKPSGSSDFPSVFPPAGSTAGRGSEALSSGGRVLRSLDFLP